MDELTGRCWFLHLLRILIKQRGSPSIPQSRRVVVDVICGGPMSFHGSAFCSQNAIDEGALEISYDINNILARGCTTPS